LISLGTFLLAGALALLLSALARRLPGPKARPLTGRWHRVTTPVTGGIALFAASGLALLPALHSGAIPPRYDPVILIGIGAFALGLLDDVWRMGVAAKLGGQLVVALVAAEQGIRPDWLDPSIGIPLSCAVIVACMNSINLLDNMDGLAAGTAAVAALGLALVGGLTADAGSPVVAGALAGACLGFLPFNYRPRRPAALFMGDAGSQLLGFALGALAVLTSPGGAGGVAAAIAAPLLILAVPALDTGLVILVRLGERRPVWEGGTDHSSHRLVYRGLSEGRAVAVLLALTAACTTTAIVLVLFQNLALTATGFGLAVAGLVAFGTRLALVPKQAGLHTVPAARSPVARTREESIEPTAARLPSDA
jgi:UDP-GlcNAc:undecaprenyl-phosphate/decaprenyl-phosphate GlcNAc-1-phosphate transferase